MCPRHKFNKFKKKKQKNCLRTVNKHGVGISRNPNPGK